MEAPVFWRGLLFKLASVFIFLTFLSFFLISMVFYLIAYAMLDADYPNLLPSAEVGADASRTASWISAAPVNRAVLDDWLAHYRDKTLARRQQEFTEIYQTLEKRLPERDRLFALTITDRNGTVLATNSPEKQEVTPFDRRQLDRVLAEGAETARVTDPEGRKGLLVAAPIRTADGRVVGAFLVRERFPFTLPEVMRYGFRDYFVDSYGSTVGLILFGFILGYPVARNAAKRLRAISRTVEKWGQGDFSQRVADRSRDELGVLGHRLNAMADELGETMMLRQGLAAAEERNRIARDLHDSVKQQVFGLSLHLGAAGLLIGKNPAAAETRLRESENLVNQIQQELVSLIRELAPADGPDDTLPGKLSKLARDWSSQSGIAARVTGDRFPPLPASEALTVFRIAQEALANAARHSQATEVVIELRHHARDGRVEGIISDNGVGFDPERTGTGFGLRNLRERAEHLRNGWLRIESGKGGTTVSFGFRTDRKEEETDE